MKLFKYNQFIKEELEDQSEVDNNLTPDMGIEGDKFDENKYSDIREEISEMIKKSLNTEDDKVIAEFIESFVKSPDDSQIEGLINDSDIYDFYLKWRNDIDDILSSIRFYDEVPSEKIKVFSLYDYIIEGTKKAISEVVSMMST